MSWRGWNEKESPTLKPEKWVPREKGGIILFLLRRQGTASWPRCASHGQTETDCKEQQTKEWKRGLVRNSFFSLYKTDMVANSKYNCDGNNDG